MITQTDYHWDFDKLRPRLDTLRAISKFIILRKVCSTETRYPVRIFKTQLHSSNIQMGKHDISALYDQMSKKILSI